MLPGEKRTWGEEGRSIQASPSGLKKERLEYDADPGLAADSGLTHPADASVMACVSECLLDSSHTSFLLIPSSWLVSSVSCLTVFFVSTLLICTLRLFICPRLYLPLIIGY